MFEVQPEKTLHISRKIRVYQKFEYRQTGFWRTELITVKPWVHICPFYGCVCYPFHISCASMSGSSGTFCCGACRERSENRYFWWSSWTETSHPTWGSFPLAHPSSFVWLYIIQINYLFLAAGPPLLISVGALAAGLLGGATVLLGTMRTFGATRFFGGSLFGGHYIIHK